MKFAAHLGVLDEVELVESAVEHLFSIGVEHIVANDLGSTDGSLEILQRMATGSSGRLRVADSRQLLDGRLASWAAEALAMACQTGADWVLFVDADERLLPASGSLRNCAALEDADLLRIDRFNVPLQCNGEASGVGRDFGDTLLVTGPIPQLREAIARLPDTPWSRGVPMPKVMARPGQIASLGIGGHDAEAPEGKPLRRIRPVDMVIAHLPFTTRERFLRKVRNARRTLLQNPSLFAGDMAWHWGRWVGLLEDGGLDAEFDRQVFAAPALRALRDQGAVESAADWFRRQARGT